MFRLARREVLSTLCGKGKVLCPLPARVARSGAERAGREAGVVQVCSAKQQKTWLNGEILSLFGRNSALFFWTVHGPFSFRQGEKKMGGGNRSPAGTAGVLPGRRVIAEPQKVVGRYAVVFANEGNLFRGSRAVSPFHLTDMGFPDVQYQRQIVLIFFFCSTCFFQTLSKNFF